MFRNHNPEPPLFDLRITKRKKKTMMILENRPTTAPDHASNCFKVLIQKMLIPQMSEQTAMEILGGFINRLIESKSI
jgi:hypothetical protein